MKKTLTTGQLKKACKQYRFVIVRDAEGFRMAVNTKIASIQSLMAGRDLKNNLRRTNWISVEPCDFQEYITYKGVFI